MREMEEKKLRDVDGETLLQQRYKEVELLIFSFVTSAEQTGLELKAIPGQSTIKKK